jgi:hypothetical protein
MGFQAQLFDAHDHVFDLFGGRSSFHDNNHLAGSFFLGCGLENDNKKSPETWRGLGALVFRGLCERLHTTSDPETSGGKIKVPIIGVQQIHTISVPPFTGGPFNEFYFRPAGGKSKREKQKKIETGQIGLSPPRRLG